MRPNYSIATLSILAVVGTAALSLVANLKNVPVQAQTSSRQVQELIDLCDSVTDSDDRFQCLLNQATLLNQAKNLARQRGERENGGVTTVETEPSMHGPSAEAPYVIETDGSVNRYTFTFRLRPRATTNFTQQAQVLVAYDQQTNQWDITTLSNEAIAPTPCSYASELQNQCF